ncbi:hypothetical protein [Mycobacterium sp. M26]|uniref:hypothetical protein n=1 Tax=Mycobacterium sp. M26 TaxID=1762962 RepID=UPI000A828140|nr:hypothetical protein [Mycobacterium sp. M26]
MVIVTHESVRPIRMRTGGLTFSMDTAEALDLANQLADAVTRINEQRKVQS